jgi:hypothetical protein
MNCLLNGKLRAVLQCPLILILLIAAKYVMFVGGEEVYQQAAAPGGFFVLRGVSVQHFA